MTVLGPEPEPLVATLVALRDQPHFADGELQPEGRGPAPVLSKSWAGSIPAWWLQTKPFHLLTAPGLDGF